LKPAIQLIILVTHGTEAGMADGRASYSVNAIEIVAATPDLQVRRFTLGVGETIPWHFHSAVTDWYFCLEGQLQVETRAPRNDFRMAPGERCEVPVKTAHKVTNAGDAICRFLLVQGVGPYDFQPVGN
jgi:quercetin dioxygenase-like cupin family protein